MAVPRIAPRSAATERDRERELAGPGPLFECMCESVRVAMWGECAWKLRGGERCGRPAVGHRDLDGQYPRALRRQAVCELHQRAADTRRRPWRTPMPRTRTGDSLMAMVAPGGGRVVPITVERGCQTLQLYRVTQHGVYVCECRLPAEVAAAGVPLAELREEDPDGTGPPQPSRDLS